MQDYAYWTARGAELQRAGDRAGALLCYLRATRLNRHAVQAWFDLGRVWQALGREAQARQAWTQSLQWRPDHAQARAALGHAALAAGRWREAAAHLEQASQLDPDDFDAQAGLAKALLALGHREDALARLNAVLERKPGCFSAWHALDEALHAHNETGSAHALYVREATALPRNPATWVAGVRYASAHGERMLLAELCSQAAAHRWQEEELPFLREIVLALRAGDDQVSGHIAILREAYGALLSRAIAKSGPAFWPRRTHAPDPRPRIAYWIDAQDTGCEVSEIVAQLARRHDPARVALTVYDARPEGGTVVHARCVSLAGMSAPLAARLIAQNDPDVLVDCAGIASAGTLELFAFQPARIRLALRARGAAPAPLITHVLQTRAGDAAVLGARVRGVPIATAFPDGTSCDEAAWQSFVRAFEQAMVELVAGLATAAIDAAALGALWQQAVAAHQAGDRVRARERYAELLALQPEYAPAQFMLGMLLQSEQAHEEAAEHLQRALELAPAFADARTALLNTWLDARRAEPALQLAAEGIACSGSSAERAGLYRLRGLAHLQRGEAREAVSAFRAAIELEPGHDQSYFNLGVALQRSGEREAAITAYQTVLVLAPAAEAYLNLGALYQEQANYPAAITCYQQVLALQPELASAYKNLGDCLFATRRYDEWIANLRVFEQRCPRALPLAPYGLQVSQHLGDFGAVDRYLEGLRKEAFAATSERELVDTLEELLYLLLFFDLESADMLAFYHAYDAAARRVYGDPMVLSAPQPHARIRVGYLSADFCDHVMGKMMLPVLERHDGARFEVFCYALNEREDNFTGRFRAAAAHYTVLAALPEAEAAARIAADEIDVLVDLSTHTKGAKPGILALKPARVQLTHVASAGALGLSSVDFKLTDACCDTPANQSALLERLLPMAACCYPVRLMRPAAAHGYRRERFGLNGEHVVIGAFVTLLKLSRRCLNLWREVLARVPQARIALSPQDERLQPYYLRVFAAAGIGRERLVFLPQGRSEEENLGRYALVDFVLDPLPFGGVNGTIEALSMGVPVVTLCGRRHGERTSYSILRHLGVEQTIATSGKEYVELAQKLALDRAFNHAVRAAIVEQMQSSPLADSAHYARALEAAYEAALAGAQATLKTERA